MPSGWITSENCNENVFNLSPVRTRQLIHYKSDTGMNNRVYFKKATKEAFSVEYILFVIWAVGAITSHTQWLTLLPMYVAEYGNTTITDFFGNIFWASSILCLIVSFFMDYVTRNREDPAKSKAKDFLITVSRFELSQEIKSYKTILR